MEYLVSMQLKLTTLTIKLTKLFAVMYFISCRPTTFLGTFSLYFSFVYVIIRVIWLSILEDDSSVLKLRCLVDSATERREAEYCLQGVSQRHPDLFGERKWQVLWWVGNNRAAGRVRWKAGWPGPARASKQVRWELTGLDQLALPDSGKHRTAAARKCVKQASPVWANWTRPASSTGLGETPDRSCAQVC